MLDLDRWPDLLHIVDGFPPVSDCSVGFLIGPDHHFTSYSRNAITKTLPENTYNPFAVCISLEWTMVSPTSNDDCPPIPDSHSYYSHNLVLTLELQRLPPESWNVWISDLYIFDEVNIDRCWNDSSNVGRRESHSFAVAGE